MTQTPASLDALRARFDVVPVVRTVTADALTPVAAFAALAGDRDPAFLLESVERGEAIGRYSFIGVRPRKSLAITRADAPRAVALLREELVPLTVAPPVAVDPAPPATELPPFFGGAVGWFGYGCAAWSERLPDRHAAPTDGADAEILFFDVVLGFDHVRQQLHVVVNLFSDDRRGSAELLARAEGELERITEVLAAARLPLLALAEPSVPPHFEASVTRAGFVSAVEAAKREIEAGEIFQIVLSQRWEAEFRSDHALTLYRVLRSVNPSPYMFLLRTEGRTLVGSSPEMLVRVQAGEVEARPIAGTRPRGATPEADALLAGELKGDAKENAEHLMLVDLGRNDVGRVAASGSVVVEQFCEIERYSHVMHLVSRVRGRLRQGATPIDAFLSAFPAGTVSGAPKIRAMELIDALENVRRGAYAGAVAYIGFSGNLDSCISIRTVVLEGERALVQAGAGIVADSDPDREYEETLSKAAALRKAIAIAAASIDEPAAAAGRQETSRAGGIA